MSDAAIFYPGNAMKIDGLTSISYDAIIGYVRSFTTNGALPVRFELFSKVSLSQDKAIQSKFPSLAYYNSDMVHQYFADKLKFDTLLKQGQLPANLLKPAEKNDLIKVIQVHIPSNTSIFTFKKWEWNHDGVSRYVAAGNNIIIPSNATQSSSSAILSQPAANFYTNNIVTLSQASFPQSDRDEAAKVLALISLTIHHLVTETFPELFGGGALDTYLSSQYAHWSTVIIPAIKKDDVYHYFSKIIAYKSAIIQHWDYLKNAPDLFSKLYWLATILHEDTLSLVPIDDRLNLLKTVAIGGIPGETAILAPQTLLYFNGAILEKLPYITNEEELAIRIVKSVSVQDADAFLKGLISPTYNLGNSSSLLANLFNDIHDRGIGDWNLGSFVKELNRVWLNSSYYPSNTFDNTLNAIPDPDITKYSANVPPDSIKDNVINENTYANKPIYIDYKADKFLWLFNQTNYDFKMMGAEIELWYQPFEIIKPELKVKKGSYSPYQAVTVKNNDENTNTISFPIYDDGYNKNALMPIFMLKYIDDKKNTENIKTAVEITFDVVTTLTGIGNLAKLRHIRHITKLGRALIGKHTITAGEKLIAWQLAEGTAGLIEVSSTVGSFYYNYIDNFENTYCNPNSSQYNQARCDERRRIYNWLLLAQLFSGPLDIVATRQLRKAARNVIDHGIPADFTNPEAIQILQKMAEYDLVKLKNEFTEWLTNPINKINLDNTRLTTINNALVNMADDQQRIAFMLDFQKVSKENVIALVDEQLIDIWKGVESLKGSRREINFLKNLKRTFNNTDLNKEIFSGNVTLKPKLNPMPPPPHAANMFSKDVKGVHSIIAVNSGNAQINNIRKTMSWQGEIFYEAKVSVLGPTGVPNTSPAFFAKKSGPSTFFPDSWSQKRIREEIAYVLSNPVVRTNKKLAGPMTNGVYLHMFIDNLKTSNGMYLSGDVTTAFPTLLSR